ncbi:MAG TPA: phytanoyl-CoA dioxygenase family protein [Pyrinomonadaceae bacterium]|nr:phytanoyl-CoA dioxygenase family protein [Pyrinomonadaceae bacterium]
MSRLFMDRWFTEMAANYCLPEDIARQLCDIGYVVIEGAVAQTERARMSAAYDAAVLAAHPDDVSVRSSTRVSDFVNRGHCFDELYIYGPLLAACCRVIARPFKLSTMLARTLEPNAPAQQLHVDFKRDGDGWPMIGFIFMIDEFRSDNGATRFVPGSHMLSIEPNEVMKDATVDYEGQTLACGPAGSVIIYNGSIWHGHTANRSVGRRRSIQGAFIRRDAQSAVNHATRIRPETIERIGNLAKYLLDL